MKLSQSTSRARLGRNLGLIVALGALAVGCAPADDKQEGSAGSAGFSSGGSSQGGAGSGQAGSGGAGQGGAGQAGSGGAQAGAGGGAGSGGAGSGGAAAGSGGAAAGSGGATAGSGGATAGSGGGDPVPEIGKACKDATECLGGTCLDPTVFPEGYCSKACSGDVLTEGDPCPKGAECVQIVEAAAVCLDSCDSKADCRPGYACKPVANGSSKVCFPGCKSDADCGSLERCDADALCQPDATKKGIPGDPCSADDGCQGTSPVCSTSAPWPGGYCSSSCTEAENKNECPGLAGTNCLAADFGAGIEYVCFGKCKTSVDCRDGYVCTADAGELLQANDKTGACVPTCKNFPCGDGYECDPTGICVQSKPNVTFQVTRKDLGTIDVDDFTAKSVSFELPDNTLSFTLVANPSKPVKVVVPVKVTSPSGTIYNYDNPLENQFKTFGLPDVPYAGLYPNTPKLNITKGTYTFELAASEPVSLKVDVLFKQGSGILDKGTMPMVFFFTEGNSFNAASAKGDSAFQTAVQKVKDTYAQVGITLTVDDTSYIDLPNSSQYGVIDERSELSGLFALANNFNQSGLNFFFIDQYAFTGGKGVLGVSGGIPGSPGLQGVTHAGVSVAYGLLKDDPDTLGIVMAHEGGHYLGLFHPTEATGQAFDPLDDTPECPASKYDSNGDGKVNHTECADAGTSNVMFWLVDGPPNKTFTTDQQFVLMRNPLVSHQ